MTQVQQISIENETYCFARRAMVFGKDEQAWGSYKLIPMIYMV